jgi:hypothetical protein
MGKTRYSWGGGAIRMATVQRHGTAYLTTELIIGWKEGRPEGKLPGLCSVRSFDSEHGVRRKGTRRSRAIRLFIYPLLDAQHYVIVVTRDGRVFVALRD